MISMEVETCLSRYGWKLEGEIFIREDGFCLPADLIQRLSKFMSVEVLARYLFLVYYRVSLYNGSMKWVYN